MPAKSPAPSAPRGRPRSERAHRAILDAALELFEEGGYPAATIDAIVARSGVAKTTIYRAWPNRATLVVDLLLQVAAEAAPPPPAGNDPLRALRTELSRVARAAEDLPGRLLLSLLSEAQNDPTVHAALQQGLFGPRREATAQVIQRAQQMGLLRTDIAPLVAVDLLYGPLFYRKFVRQESVDESCCRIVFEHFVTGMDPTRARPTRRARAAKAARRRRRSGG